MSSRRSIFARLDQTLLVALSLVFFVLVLLAVLRDERSEWLPFQERFQEILEENDQRTAAEELEPGIRQIWIPALDRVDRCVSCHLGYEWGASLPADLPEPLAPHPDLPFMRAHPFQDFGCTGCHGGQGFATERAAAHGDVAHWGEPLLSTGLAERYGLTRAELMQTRCNQCHRHEPETQGMDEINQAKDLFGKKKCLHCHSVDGHGGNSAPDLTYIGDKNPELVDFTYVEGRHTFFNWLIEHFIDPDVVTPDTEMPPYGFSGAQARQLALLMLSWKKLSLPPRYIPRRPPPEAAQVVRERPLPPQVPGAEVGRGLFLTHGCHTCHGVGVSTAIGPDLAGLSQRRTPAWLRQWLADPAAMLRAEPELASWPEQWGGIIMPNQNLDPTEIEELTRYLSGL